MACAAPTWSLSSGLGKAADESGNHCSRITGTCLQQAVRPHAGHHLKTIAQRHKRLHCTPWHHPVVAGQEVQNGHLHVRQSTRYIDPCYGPDALRQHGGIDRQHCLPNRHHQRGRRVTPQQPPHQRTIWQRNPRNRMSQWCQPLQQRKGRTGKRGTQHKPSQALWPFCRQHHAQRPRKRLGHQHIVFVLRQQRTHPIRQRRVAQALCARIRHHLRSELTTPSGNERSEKLACTVHTWEQNDGGHWEWDMETTWRHCSQVTFPFWNCPKRASCHIVWLTSVQSRICAGCLCAQSTAASHPGGTHPCSITHRLALARAWRRACWQAVSDSASTNRANDPAPAA